MRWCGTILSTGAGDDGDAALRSSRGRGICDGQAACGQLRRFNLSVLVSDALITAVRSDDDWPLIFPAKAFGGYGETVLGNWPGETGSIPCHVLRRAKARQLWERILRANYDYSEPGVLFIDRINHLNNLWYREQISATNPCGEIPLPAYGACDLGSLNLTRFVRSPLTKETALDLDDIARATRICD
jgi:ribonucleoside-diphosphate reductase alpha chain